MLYIDDVYDLARLFVCASLLACVCVWEGKIQEGHYSIDGGLGASIQKICSPTPYCDEQGLN